MDHSGDGVRPGRDGLALLIDLFPVKHSHGQCMAGLDGDDGYDLGAGRERRRYVCVDYVAYGVGDLELEAAAGVSECECWTVSNRTNWLVVSVRPAESWTVRVTRHFAGAPP